MPALGDGKHRGGLMTRYFAGDSTITEEQVKLAVRAVARAAKDREDGLLILTALGLIEDDVKSQARGRAHETGLASSAPAKH